MAPKLRGKRHDIRRWDGTKRSGAGAEAPAQSESRANMSHRLRLQALSKLTNKRQILVEGLCSTWIL